MTALKSQNLSLDFYRGMANTYKGRYLEAVIALILSNEGYRTRALGKKFANEEIDIWCERGIGRSISVLICECKHVNERQVIGKNDVDKLVMRIGKVKEIYYPNQNTTFEGRFYTTSRFDEEALNFTLKVGKYSISLIDGEKLKSIFSEVGLSL